MHPIDTDYADEDDVLVALALVALSFLAFVAVLLAGWGRDFLPGASDADRTARPDRTGRSDRGPSERP